MPPTRLVSWGGDREASVTVNPPPSHELGH